VKDCRTALRVKRWAATWPDALAFALGLAIAWWAEWNTTDLVWSLWLSSLVIGYATIVWILSEPLRELVRGLWLDRKRSGYSAGAKIASIAVVSALVLFGLAFFTLHFGGFHVGHSVFLNSFFPISDERFRDLVPWRLYGEVFRRYWWFLPAAALAERHVFRLRSTEPDTAVTPEAIAARKAKGDAMWQPYKNVVRMHLLIFFFFVAHVAKFENFLVYAVVYAAYFFPWRMIRPAKTAGAPA
jgi:hypothetical protein